MPGARSEPFAERACPLGACDGSGWIVGPEEVARPCECREERLRRARSRGIASVIPAKYRGVSFDRPPVTEIEPMVVRVVRAFTEDLEDDLGAEKRSDWVLEQLYALINERYEAQRSILVTTNLDEAALEEQIGPRTVSRLVEICGDPLPLFGQDRRYDVRSAGGPLGGAPGD